MGSAPRVGSRPASPRAATASLPAALRFIAQPNAMCRASLGPVGVSSPGFIPPQLPVRPQPLTGGAAPEVVTSSAQCKHRSSTAKASGVISVTFLLNRPHNPIPAARKKFTVPSKTRTSGHPRSPPRGEKPTPLTPTSPQLPPGRSLRRGPLLSRRDLHHPGQLAREALHHPLQVRQPVVPRVHQHGAGGRPPLVRHHPGLRQGRAMGFLSHKE